MRCRLSTHRGPERGWRDGCRTHACPGVRSGSRSGYWSLARTPSTAGAVAGGGRPTGLDPRRLHPLRVRQAAGHRSCLRRRRDDPTAGPAATPDRGDPCRWSRSAHPRRPGGRHAGGLTRGPVAPLRGPAGAPDVRRGGLARCPGRRPRSRADAAPGARAVRHGRRPVRVLPPGRGRALPTRSVEPRAQRLAARQRHRPGTGRDDERGRDRRAAAAASRRPAGLGAGRVARHGGLLRLPDGADPDRARTAHPGRRTPAPTAAAAQSGCWSRWSP